MLVAERALTHVGELDGTLGAGVHEPVAAHGVELCSRDNFCQLFHVRRLNVHDVEALVLDVQVPEIYAQIITADEGLSVTVDRYAVDMISMGISICPARHGCNHSVVMGKPGKLQVACRLELGVRCRTRSSPAAGHVCWCEVVREVILSYDLERLLKDLP